MKETKYSNIITNADFYTLEAIRHYKNPFKRIIFIWLAKKYKEEAKEMATTLPIMEALR